MSNIWFCSDLHLGHKNIGTFRFPLVNSTDENTSRVLSDWNKQVTKRDTVYVLGDFCFNRDLYNILELPGKKYLVRGNHDNFNASEYLRFFDDVYGLLRYKEFWLSHAPIHSEELRGKVNLHGHVHFNSINDNRYFNCCPEALWATYGSCLVSLDEIRNHYRELSL